MAEPLPTPIPVHALNYPFLITNRLTGLQIRNSSLNEILRWPRETHTHYDDSTLSDSIVIHATVSDSTLRNSTLSDSTLIDLLVSDSTLSDSLVSSYRVYANRTQARKKLGLLVTSAKKPVTLSLHQI